MSDNEEPFKKWTARPGGGYDLLKWEATIQNLDDPRHRGKKYRLLIEIPMNYPFVPPLVRFIDKVKCENVYPNGELCLDILKGEWSPAFTLWTLLESIASVLTDKPITGLSNKIPTTMEMVTHNIHSSPLRIPEPIRPRRKRRTELEMLSV
jgi:ubiquitin-protein ligase